MLRLSFSTEWVVARLGLALPDGQGSLWRGVKGGRGGRTGDGAEYFRLPFCLDCLNAIERCRDASRGGRAGPDPQPLLSR